MESQFLPFLDATDLTNLSNWTAGVKATVQGESVTPFTLHAVLPKVASNSDTARGVRELSRRKYGGPRAEVEPEIELSLAHHDERSLG